MPETGGEDFRSNAKLVLFGIGVVLALLLAYYSINVLVVSLIGIGIGVIVGPIFSMAKKRFNIPRALTAVLYVLFIIVVLGGAAFAIWFLVSDQVKSLYQRMPDIFLNLQGQLEKYPWIRDQLQKTNVGTTVKGFASTFYSGLLTGFSALSGFVFACIISLYTAVSLNQYYEGFLTLFPKKHREKAACVLGRCATTLRSWLRAMLIDMLILGVLTALGLWLVGIDYWGVFGILTALFAVIPYIGILIVVVCATLITWASEPSLVSWVLVVFFVTQQIEGNVVIPLVMKGQVELPEAHLLIFMLFLGALLGLLGVLIAPPLFAVLRVLYVELYLPRVNEEVPSSACN